MEDTGENVSIGLTQFLVHLDHLKQDQTFGLMRGPGIGVLGHNLKCYGCIYNPVSYKDIGEEYMWQ